MKTDGFQADTEEDEDEADCVIISTQKGQFPGILSAFRQELSGIERQGNSLS